MCRGMRRAIDDVRHAARSNPTGCATLHIQRADRRCGATCSAQHATHVCPITHTDLERSKARPPAPPGSPNVVICVIDGLSRAAFMSYFPKTIRFLEQSTDPAYGFKAMQFQNFHAMGFSTVENVPWLLFGPLDARTSEPRRSLFQRFQHRGYACAR